MKIGRIQVLHCDAGWRSWSSVRVETDAGLVGWGERTSPGARVAIRNARIMEMDIDDVAWKDPLVTHPPKIVDGHMLIPTAPGWGTEINERALAEHVRDGARWFSRSSADQ